MVPTSQGRIWMLAYLGQMPLETSKNNWAEIVNQLVKSEYGLAGKYRTTGGSKYKGNVHILFRHLSPDCARSLKKNQCVHSKENHQ